MRKNYSCIADDRNGIQRIGGIQVRNTAGINVSELYWKQDLVENKLLVGPMWA